MRVDINQACQQGSAAVSLWGCALPLQRRNAVSVPAQLAIIRQLALKLSQAKILLGYGGIANVNREENEHEAICSCYTMVSRMATLQTQTVRREKHSVQIKQSSPHRYLGKRWHLADSVVPAQPLKVVYHASSSNVLEILGQPFNFHQNLTSGW